MLNKRQLAKLGWSPALIASVLDKPDEVKHHKRGMVHWVEHLYLDSRVQTGMRDPRFLAVLAVRRERERQQAARRARIPERYAGWRAALPDAAAGLFSLNRYAKHRECSALSKREIYDLKNQLIALLWRNGYCTLSWIHKLELPEQKCRECAGDGEFCDRCDGSGIWREARIIEFWCFRFLIGGKPYCWHQPRELVEFTPEESVPPQDWEGVQSEKPVPLAKSKFLAAKELLRWVLSAEAEAAIAPVVDDAVPFDCPPVGESRCVSAQQQSLF